LLDSLLQEKYTLHTMEVLGQLENRTYSYVLPFEEEFDASAAKNWTEVNWRAIVAWCSGAYMLMVFGGQAFMANRPPFKLRSALTVWNVFLAVFSIIGAARTLPEFLHTISKHGLYSSFCSPSFIEEDRVSGFWTFMFVLSKVPELGDTVFIVLRKQKLIFLHWYHHLTVLIYVFYSFKEFAAPARWFMVMNFLCHSAMYSYYALKALRFRVPKGIAMVITSMQLLQMFVGCIVTYTAFQIKNSGKECNVSDTTLQMSLIMYLSYAVLFARFFLNAYCSPNEKFTDEVLRQKND